MGKQDRSETEGRKGRLGYYETHQAQALSASKALAFLWRPEHSGFGLSGQPFQSTATWQTMNPWRRNVDAIDFSSGILY